MPRWKSAGQIEEAMYPNGDTTFIGMDMKTHDPANMQQGYYREGYNVRVEQGGLATRKGSLCPGALNTISYGQIYGVGLFSDPNRLEWLGVATKNGVWFVRDGEYPNFVPLSELLNFDVEFSQSFDTFFLWRGPDHTPLLWKGEWSQFWEAFPPATGGRQTVPNAYTAENAANRMLVPFGRDQVAVSDIADYTEYDWTINDFQINQGESDQLVRVFPWQQNQVIMFKGHSIFRVTNVSGDLSQATLEKLPGTLGLVGRKAVTEVSGDIYFMSQNGVFKMSQVMLNTPQPDDLPLSDLIKPVIDAINWNYANLIRAEYRRDRVYFAIPLKGSTRNNCLIVYNITSGGWESIDTFTDPDFRIDDLVKMDYNGERRLYAIDRIKGVIVLLEQGRTDLLGPNYNFEWQIDTSIMTRGYSGPDNRDAFERMEMDIASWNPKFTITAFVDSGQKKVLVSDKQKNRTRYNLFGKPQWNPLNSNDDHAAPKRQDYSVQLPFMLGYNGVQIEREAESSERYDIFMKGRYVQYKLENTQGTINIRSIIHEAFGDEREPRTH